MRRVAVAPTLECWFTGIDIGHIVIDTFSAIYAWNPQTVSFESKRLLEFDARQNQCSNQAT
jgi:hypothetical protein